MTKNPWYTDRYIKLQQIPAAPPWLYNEGGRITLAVRLRYSILNHYGSQTEIRRGCFGGTH